MGEASLKTAKVQTGPVGFALPIIGSACLPASAPVLPGIVSGPYDQMGLEDTLHSGWGCDSAPFLGGTNGL